MTPSHAQGCSLQEILSKLEISLEEFESLSEPAPVEDRLCSWRKARDQLIRISSLFCLRMTDMKLLHIAHRPRRQFAATLRRKLPGATPDDAFDSCRQFLFRSIDVAGKVLGRIMNGVVHQIDCGIVVIKVRPGAQGSI